MKFLLARATIVASLALSVLSADTAGAQAPRRRGPPTGPIRVIDINKIFKNHKRFNGQLEEFRQHVAQIEAEVGRERQAVADLQIRLKQLKPSSDEFKNLERDILNRKGKFNAEATLKKRDLLEREAKIYYFTYKEIRDEVAYYCKMKNVGLVIRFNSEPVDPENRASVMRAVANPIVAQRHIDITDTILRVLNRGGPAGPPVDPNVSSRTGPSPR